MLWFIAFACFFFQVFEVQSATLTVGKDQAVKSLKMALLKVENGDTIILKSGTYYEHNIDIRKSITLLGEGKPVIDGQHKYEMLFVYASHVNISGITFKNSGSANMEDIAAITFRGAEFCHIYNNIFDNNYFGLHFDHAKGCKVENNVLRGNFKGESVSGNGIHFWKSDSNFIINNNISGHRDGIYFEFVTNTLISGNESHHNQRYGLHFMFSDGNTYERNYFHHNGSGVAVMYTRNINMRNNTFELNWGGASYGLLLKEISRSVIENNFFIQNTTGIVMEESSAIKIRNNTFRSNGTAIRFSSSSTEDTLSDNNFIANTFDLTSNGSINTNYFTANYWDKYRGYDLNKDNVGDVPYRPVSLFSMIMEQIPNAVMLLRSVVADILDQVEKVFPDVIPESLVDGKPAMQPYKLENMTHNVLNESILQQQPIWNNRNKLQTLKIEFPYIVYPKNALAPTELALNK